MKHLFLQLYKAIKHLMSSFTVCLSLTAQYRKMPQCTCFGIKLSCTWLKHAPSGLLPSPAERKLTSTTWRKDPSGAEQLHRRLLDNHGYLTVSGPISHSSLSLSICFPQTPNTAEQKRFGADNLTELAFSDTHRASTVRMRSVRLGLLWVKDGEEEEEEREDGAPLN